MSNLLSSSSTDFDREHDLPTIKDIMEAKVMNKKSIPCTRLIKASNATCAKTGIEIYFKCEYTLPTKSFKERGACFALKKLSIDENLRGVVTASAGNHALALAYHGGLLNIPVNVYMPIYAPNTKISRCREYGANVILHGSTFEEAKIKATQVSKDDNLVYINGYNDRNIIAGAGTMIMEILDGKDDESSSEFDAIVIPCGGGGLLAGTVTAGRQLSHSMKFYCVEPEHCASMITAFDQGQSTLINQTQITLADGLAVPAVGERAYQCCKKYGIDGFETVSEKYIAIAILHMIEYENIVVEGAGVSAFAAVLQGKFDFLKGQKVVIPLCGGNIDASVLGRCIQRGLSASDRLVKIWVTVSDRPGGIAKLTGKLAAIGASVKDMIHNRFYLYNDIYSVEISIVLEMEGKAHVQRLETMLSESDYIFRMDTR